MRHDQGHRRWRDWQRLADPETPHNYIGVTLFACVELGTGIEPALSAWPLTVCQGALAKMAKGTRSGTGAVSDVNER